MKRAVAGIVVFQDKIIIGRKGIKEGHFLSGAWHIPGGHMIEGETEEEALIREYKEETNLNITITKKICYCHYQESNTVVHWYLCTTDDCNARPGDDVDAIEFVDKDKVYLKCDRRATSLWPKEVLDYLLH